MNILLNGEARQVSATTVTELITEVGLAGQAVAVEVNRNLIPKRQHTQTPLQDGDQIELVTLVGGG